MKLPALKRISTSRSMVDVFKGYNHNLRIGDGEFYEMTNLSSDDYPVLSPRRKRGVYVPGGDLATPTSPTGMISKDSFCYVDGSKFIINGYEIDMGLSDSPKELISMGAYVIIMPDKKYINTADLTDHGPIEASFVQNGPVQFELCKIDGEGYEDMYVQESPPLRLSGEHEDGTLWLDTSGETLVLKRYSTASSQWVSVPTTYIKITATGIGELFEEGEGVTISGITLDKFLDLNSTTIIQARGNDYIIVTGIVDDNISKYIQALTYGVPPISVKRVMPNMDFIIESGNRLWGCRYGLALNGQVVNEIYASKLGDFKNWNTFASISTDSYVATVGTDGKFTGAITHNGYPLFFKENCIHKVYGSYPANYQIQTIACRGVQDGSAKSLAIVNETLYYKSRSAVCAYDGSLPVEISNALGDISYTDAVAGALGNKYYISMKDEKGAYNLFVYDTKKGMWHREDDTQATAFCNCRGELYYIDYADKQIKTVRGTGRVDANAVQWEAVTGIIGIYTPDKKYVSRIDVRMSLGLGTRATIYAEYDSSGAWEHIYEMEGASLRTVAVPVRSKRFDHLRLKIVGTGDVKVYSITKTISQGSDV